MIVEISSLIILEVIVGISPQELQSKQAFIGLLMTAIEQFLAAITRFEGLFQLCNSSEAILKCGIFDLLGHFFV